MQGYKNRSAVWSAGMVAVLLSAFLLAFPAAPTFAATDDKMADSKMMDKVSDTMMERKSSTLRGQIANVQLDNEGRPAWIQSGTWVLRFLPDDRVSFSAKINMVAPDGTSFHRHTINRLSLDDYTVQDNVHAVTGTATISTKDGNFDGVPIEIRVENDAVITLAIEPSSLGGHFGDSAIYGTVTQPRAKGAMTMEAKLSRTSVPVTLPLTRGYVDGHEVFYISTEASDRDLAEHLTKVTGSRVAFAPSLARAPAESLANIYAFSNGIKGEGPLGFQPNVADSQPGDARYSPLWRINTVEWQAGVTPRELTSEQEILDAASAGQVKITFTEMVVNCPFVKWEGGSLEIRKDKRLADDTPYGGGQVLDIDTEKMQVTFVAHRGFAPDGSTIYYIATDASAKEAADALGVVYVENTGATLVTGSSSDLWVFTNGIKGTGPMGFQASIAGSNVGDEAYSPLWRILATTWKDAGAASSLQARSRSLTQEEQVC